MFPALTTLANVKAYLKISDTNRDAIINFLIPKVSDLIQGETLCGRNFFNTTYTDELIKPFEHRDYFYTKTYPINSVSAVSVRSALPGSYVAFVSTDFEVDGNKRFIQMLNGHCFLGITNEIKVTYIAGFGAAITDLPQEIVQAATEWISILAREKIHTFIDENGISNEIILSAFPKYSQSIIDGYKIKRF